MSLGFDPFYCQPGLAGSHENGGVEGEVGRFRRTRLSPMPVVDSLDQLNERIRGWEAVEDGRRIGDRIRSVGEDFAAEQPLLAPLPGEAFDPGLVLNPRVDRSALITVRMVKYSGPGPPDRAPGAGLATCHRSRDLRRTRPGRPACTGRRPWCVLGAAGSLPRSAQDQTRGDARLDPLARARESGSITAAHEAFWAETRKVNGDAEGIWQLIDVLLLHRSMPDSDVVAGITGALSVGAVTADVVAVEARRHANNHSGPIAETGLPVPAPSRRVVSPASPPTTSCPAARLVRAY